MVSLPPPWHGPDPSNATSSTCPEHASRSCLHFPSSLILRVSCQHVSVNNKTLRDWLLLHYYHVIPDVTAPPPPGRRSAAAPSAGPSSPRRCHRTPVCRAEHFCKKYGKKWNFKERIGKEGIYHGNSFNPALAATGFFSTPSPLAYMRLTFTHPPRFPSSQAETMMINTNQNPFRCLLEREVTFQAICKCFLHILIAHVIHSLDEEGRVSVARLGNVSFITGLLVIF